VEPQGGDGVADAAAASNRARSGLADEGGVDVDRDTGGNQPGQFGEANPW
jgi:hypothetical protein